MNRDALRTVMYVDDEPDIREIVQLTLELTSQLSVHACESGEQALALLPQIRPDIMLIDVMMPHMDGPATFARVRSDARFARMPIAFMTAKTAPAHVARFKEMGAAGVISKPFDPQELAKQIIAIWEDLPDG